MIQAMAKQIVIFFIAESFDIKNFTTVLKDFKAKEKLNTWNKNGMTGLATIDVTAAVKFLASGLTGMQAQAA